MEPLPFPGTVENQMIARHLAEQLEEEGKVPREQEEASKVEEIIRENVEEEGEVTKGAILGMFAHCNVVELDIEASQFFKDKVKAKNVDKPILPCTFGESSYYGLCDIKTAVNVTPFEFYLDMQDELELAELLNTDMTVMLADKIIRVTMGVIKDVPISLVHIHIPLNF
jgi:hypothetical protein